MRRCARRRREFVAASVPEMLDAQSRLNAVLTAVDPSADDATNAARIVEQLGNVIGQRQSDGIQHGRRPVGQHQRHAGSDREGVQGDGRARQVQSRDAAERRRRQDDGRRRRRNCRRSARARNASSRSARRSSTPTITARPFWRRPASSMSGSASACSSWSTACRRKPTPPPRRPARRFPGRRSTMLALGAATLIGSVLFVWLYVGRSILRRMRDLQAR